jgi:hypothetical protein
MDEIKKRECWGGLKCHKRPRREDGNCVCLGGVQISCSNIHKSELEQEIHLKRSSRAEREWTMKDWQAAMDEIKNRGCWGIMKYRKDSVHLGGSAIRCSQIHKAEEAMEIQIKRVTLGGVRIECSKIHKSELEKEIKLKRSSRAEGEWTIQDWRAAVDQIRNRGCWGMKHRNGKGRDRGSVTLYGVRIRCSKIHKSDFVKEIQLKRSSRAEWTMKDWQAALDQIPKRRMKYQQNGN